MVNLTESGTPNLLPAFGWLGSGECNVILFLHASCTEIRRFEDGGQRVKWTLI
jgi:hypothetical protein